MAIRIKVESIDFEEAEDFGFAYGKDLGRTSTNFVYVELGREKDYTPSHKDDPKTKYRCFLNSSVYYSKTEEMVDDGMFVHIVNSETVIIYC